MLRRHKKMLLLILGVVMLLVAVRAVLEWQFRLKKEALLKTIVSQVQDRIQGKVNMGDIHLEVLRNFPNITLSVQSVSIRDSLWSMHHHDVLNVSNVYITVGLSSLWKQQPTVKNIQFSKAKLYVYVDSSGYSNVSAFQLKSGSQPAKTNAIPPIQLKQSECIYDIPGRKKYFRWAINSLNITTQKEGESFSFYAHTEGVVKDFIFNKDRGSFIKNKRLKTSLAVQYNTVDKTISIDNQKLYFDDDAIFFSGKMELSKQQPTYSIQLSAPHITIHNTKELVTPYVRNSLSNIDLQHPISLYATIDGVVKYRYIPTIKVSWEVKNNVLIAGGEEIHNCSFNGYYFEAASKDSTIPGIISYIFVPQFTGAYMGIPINGQSLQVQNLRQPVLSGNLQSHFNVSHLNETIVSNALQIKGGSINANLRFKVGLGMADTTAPEVYGRLNIHHFGFKYLPRNIVIDSSDISLLFDKYHLSIANTKLHLNKSELNVSGSIFNFLNFYFANPDKITFNWLISSPHIDLEDMKGMFAHRINTTTNSKLSQKNALAKASDAMDAVLEKSSVAIQLSVDSVVYNQFAATDIAANVLMGQTGITIKDASIYSAGGSLKWQANIDQQGIENNIELYATIRQVNVGAFFKSFNNFGLKAIQSENIKGILDADAKLQMSFTDDGEVIPESLSGNIGFLIKEGEFNHFKPFEKMNKLILKKRNLSHITFQSIKNNLEFIGSHVKINPMYIESSALVVKVEGIYGFKKGTHIFMDIPLRNPQKDMYIADDSLRQSKSMKGIVLRLKAVEDDEGKLQITMRGSEESLPMIPKAVRTK